MTGSRVDRRHGFPGSTVVIEFEVRRGRQWLRATVAGLDRDHAIERMQAIYGWSPLIRDAETRETLWTRKPKT